MLDLSAIKGQQKAVEILHALLSANRVPHALVFSGPEGVGKRHAADVFARAIFCRGEAVVPCGSCDPCRKIARGALPDLIHVEVPEGRTRILIDQVREIERIVAYHPFSGDVRVIIIDPADLMTEDAAAAILKTLEEPPSGTHFILVTSRASSLPPTILSRCQKVRFSPLAPEVIAEILGGDQKANEAADMARGSIPRAESILKGGLVAAQERMIGLLSSMGLNDPDGIEELFSGLSKFKVEFSDILDILKCWLRDLIVYRETHREGDLIYHGLVKEFAGAWTDTEVRSLMEGVDAIDEVERTLTGRMYLNMRIALESLFIRLVELKHNR
jgi:DNA polymerase-3 subunit delta'